MALYVYEFLYRGPQQHNGNKGAWHIVLGNDVADGFGNTKTLTSGPMTPEAAKAAGVELPAILAEINTEVMAQLTAAQAKLR